MTGNSSAILVLKDVSKAFGGMPVLQHVDLEVPRGSIVSLLGASGSGKTTLLQIIAGLQEPDGGKLSIDGRDMQGVPAFARPVNMMFQSYALFPHLTVRGNVEYGLKARGVDRHEWQRLVVRRAAPARGPRTLPGHEASDTAARRTNGRARSWPARASAA